MKSRSLIKFLIASLMIALLTVPLISSAKTETLVFQWDYTVGAIPVVNWQMDWGVTAGGPYTKLADIPYVDPGSAPYESPVEAVVTGQPGTHETRYFILRACGDVPLEAGGTEYQCSDPSNEVAYSFWIEATGFSAPINFRTKPAQ